MTGNEKAFNRRISYKKQSTETNKLVYHTIEAGQDVEW